MLNITPMRATRMAGIALLSAALLSPATGARAGNGANFVVYDHHTEDAGTTEIKLFNDLSRTADEGERYSAQLLELEHALTDRWVVAAYLESHKINGEDWSFDGARFETRYRLFDYGTPLNPVVYLEYVNKKEASLFLREVTGRIEHGEAGEGEHEEENERENELESKLILGQDISDRLRVGFNWINEVNLKSGDWDFGYATGLTYTVFEHEGEQKSPSFDVKEVQLGLEVFGGLGNSAKGLTLASGETEQYLGVNLKTEFANGAMVMAGGAFGLTSDSRDNLFRVMIGWEFE
jgi:hypothetical protein